MRETQLRVIQVPERCPPVLAPPDAIVLGSAEPGPTSPVIAYLATLSEGSRTTMSRSLALVATLVAGEGADPLSLPWRLLRHEHVAAVRGMLADRYAPATANRHLAALRGVLKAAWRLGQMSAEDLARATDVPSVRGSTVPAGREITHGEIGALIRACGDCPRGRRDAVLLATGYGAGLRRAEIAGLDLADIDLEAASVLVRHGKGNRQRMTYLASGGEELIARWIAVRGDAPGALLHPVRRGGRMDRRRISPHGVYRALDALRERAGVTPFSTHDLRRSWISHLLAAGADISTCQRLAGHSQVSTTQRYDRRPEEEKKKASRLLHLPI